MGVMYYVRLCTLGNMYGIIGIMVAWARTACACVCMSTGAQNRRNTQHSTVTAQVCTVHPEPCIAQCVEIHRRHRHTSFTTIRHRLKIGLL